LKTAQHNAAGENSGSCKLFSFGTAGTNSEGTLACFGAYYFEDVIGNQMGLIHQNIRNFMKTGWDGIILLQVSSVGVKYKFSSGQTRKSQNRLKRH
jgi:hypothetical protein